MLHLQYRMSQWPGRHQCWFSPSEVDTRRYSRRRLAGTTGRLLRAFITLGPTVDTVPWMDIESQK